MTASLPRRLAHRLWQVLPRGLRRRAFVAATRARAPRPDAVPPVLSSSDPAVVVGVLRNGSGLGESARMNLTGLQAAGRPCSYIDLSGSWLGAAELPALAPPVVPPTGRGALIVHASAPFMAYALARCGKDAVAGKRVIGLWHWELERLPREWAAGCDLVHELWVPSRFCAAAMATRFRGPIRIVPHAVDVSMAPPPRQGEQRPFTVVTVFNMASGFERKNPLATIQAFIAAFGADPGALLVVKTMNGAVWPAGMAALHAAAEAHANIRIVEETMSRADVLGLVAGADAVSSLHRSEGFGLLAAEAMLLGRPVLATDWSATAEFVTAQNGIPIPYRLIPAIDPQRTYHFPDLHWADADIAAAAAGLQRLRADPAAAAALGQAGRATAEALFSQQAYAAAVAAALDA